MPEKETIGQKIASVFLMPAWGLGFLIAFCAGSLDLTVRSFRLGWQRGMEKVYGKPAE